MLFMVIEYGYGHTFSAVRADNAEQAKQLAGASRLAIGVIPLAEDGPPAVLWQDEDSPDSPRDRD